MINNDGKETHTSHDGIKSPKQKALELFGPMREATEEERESVRRYIDSISVNTGINIFDLLDKGEKHDNPY